MPLCACSSRPCRVRDRAGERAAHVAEQLGLEQRLRNRAAVDRDEAVGAPRAVVMDGARGQLLAGAGLAGDQHRARRRRDGLEQLEQIAHHAAAARRARRCDSAPRAASAGRRSPICSRRCSSAESSTCSSASNWNGLVMKSAAPCLMASTASFTVPKPVMTMRDDVGVALERGVEHLPAVDAGQPQVGDEDVEGERRPAARAPASPLPACSTTNPWSASRSAIASRSAASSSTISRCFWPSAIYAGGRYFDTPRRSWSIAHRARWPTAARRPLR